MPGRLYSMVDLFAGCGGLSLGFEQAGFTPIFVNELDKDALDSYLMNRHHSLGGEPFSKNADLHCNDAGDLDRKRLEQARADWAAIPEINFHADKNGSSIDVLAGGPPCQGYSAIGRRRLYDVERSNVPANYLYAQMAEIVSDLRPRIFLFENVRGIMKARWGKDAGSGLVFPDVWNTFRSIDGYETRWSILFARNYGVAQHRPRLFIVGIRQDIVAASDLLKPGAHETDAVACNFLPMGEKGLCPDLVDLLGDLEDPDVPDMLRSGRCRRPGPFLTPDYPSDPLTPIQRELRRLPEWVPADRSALTDHQYSKHRLKAVEKFDHMIRTGGEIPECHSTRKLFQRLLPARWGKRGPNITATTLPDDYVHYSQPRILSVREWARLQMFPDWYRFSGRRTTGGTRRAGNPLEGQYERELSKYTQIGNAVPVSMAEKIGGHLRQVLESALEKPAAPIIVRKTMLDAEDYHDLQARAKEMEWYETPEWAADAILKVELMTSGVLDPCAGRGPLGRSLRRAGYKDVVEIDLMRWPGQPETVDAGVNFFDVTPKDLPFEGDFSIFMNPPFSLATEFVEHSFLLGARKVVAFQRMAFLESSKRRDFWKKNGATRVHICGDRAVSWRGDIPEEDLLLEGGVRIKGRKGRSTPTAHAWFVFERGHGGGMMVHHLFRDDFQLQGSRLAR